MLTSICSVHRLPVPMLLGADRDRVGYCQPEHPHALPAGHTVCPHDHGRYSKPRSLHMMLRLHTQHSIQTIVAWVMVLVRLRYFREHILRRHRQKTMLASMRDRVVKIASGVRHSVPGRRSGEGQEKHAQHGSHGIQASDGIGAALAGGATTGLGLGIALGAADSTAAGDLTADELKGRTLTQSQGQWSDTSSHIGIQIESPLRVSPSEEPTMISAEADPGERGIITDADLFTSSPKSGAMPLQSPTSMGTGHVQFPYMQSIGDVGTVRRRPGQ